MEREFDLERYLSNGVENIVKGAVRATLKDPRESIFIAKYAVASREATKKRRQAREQGENIPPFLIASITSSCNLHCAGCYARSNQACSDTDTVAQLSQGEWQKIFMDARKLGVGFILLAGGEPMLRKDVLATAGTIPEIIFPIFTNGTQMDDEMIRMLDQSRNLIPVISVEGHQGNTDQRRGAGVYQKVVSAMDALNKRHLTFGASITFTTENMDEITSDEFVHTLEDKGTKVVFYVEFVPVTNDTKHLAPGDEKTSGGCLAAGRGFFHINSQGGAEPCPFSPYSDINVRDTSLKEALHSDLFQKLQNQNILLEDHAGGCILFEKKEIVEALL